MGLAVSDPDPDLSRLDRCLAQLSDHWDSVQIIATRHNGTATIVADRGTGNWYSRFGATSEWVERQRATLHARVFHDDRETPEFPA